MNSVSRSVLCGLAYFLMMGSAFAWSAEGHRIIAQIAFDRMKSVTRTRAEGLLSKEGYDFVRDADWADRIRGKARYTSKWHYVDIPFDSLAYDASRDCRLDNCVVAQLRHELDILRKSDAPLTQRAEALLFAIHFVGDLGQPLHCINRNVSGGNADKVIYEGRRTNLHSFWDQTLVAMQGRGAAQIAGVLERQITSKEAVEWEGGRDGLGNRVPSDSTSVCISGRSASGKHCRTR